MDVRSEALKVLMRVVEDDALIFSTASELSRDISNYRLFFLDDLTALANLPTDWGVQEVHRWGSECTYEFGDAYDAVPWPFHKQNTVFVASTKAGTVFLSVPYKRKGNFNVLQAYLSGGELRAAAMDYGYSQDLFVLPDVSHIHGPYTHREAIEEKDARNHATPLMIVMYGVSLVSTRALPSAMAVAANPTNKKRMARGKKPLFDWTTVEVKAAERLHGTPSEKTGIKHRLHEVRGHWCVRKSTGKRYWRKAHKRGDASLGIVFHDYTVKS